jgi:tetratricopeptide (TPR) repeat protein
MYIDRRYRPRRHRSPWPIVALLVLVVAGGYLLATRTRFFVNPFDPLQPTPTPTRSAASHLAEAEEHYQAGRLAAAAKAYARVAGLEPANDDAFAQQAWLMILLGHADQAIDLAKKAVDLDPNAHNLSMLAMAQDWAGLFDDAIKTALRAVDKDPLSAEAHAVLAEVYADKNNWIRALEEARTAAKLKPDSPLVQRNLGYVLERQGRHDEALDAYERAGQLAPRLGFSYIGAGNTYIARGDYESALAQFQKAVEANPDSPVGYDALGHGSATAGDPDRAISMLRKAIEIDPTYGQAHAHLGRVYYSLLNWEAAIDNFTKAMELGVRNEMDFYELGLSYAYLKECANAVKWLEKALELNPNSKPALDGLKLCSSG